MSQRESEITENSKVIEECNNCGKSMLSAYIEDGLCYRCRTTDADEDQ